MKSKSPYHIAGTFVSLSLIFAGLMGFGQGCGVRQTEVLSDNGNTELASKDKYRLKHYMIEGRRLFDQHCSNCHQKDGSGLGQLIPPLNDSDYLLKNIEQLACIIKYGLEGEIMVNGKDYNQPMPENRELTALEIAEICTYVANTWTENKRLMPVKEIESSVKNCANHSTN